MLSDEALIQLQYLLQEKSADPNIVDLSGFSPLHHLCNRGKPICDNVYLNKTDKLEWEGIA